MPCFFWIIILQTNTKPVYLPKHPFRRFKAIGQNKDLDKHFLLSKSKSMRKIYTSIFMLFFLSRLIACEIETGNLVVENFANQLKIYLDKEPQNSCFYADSSSLMVTIVCKKTGIHETKNIGVKDTLIYETFGTVTILSSVKWWRKGVNIGRTDIKSKCVEKQGGGCFSFVEVSNEGSPQISTETPPPPTHEINVHGNLVSISTPWPGALLLIDVQGNVVEFHEFETGDFDFSGVAPGLYFLNVLIYDPNGLMSERILVNF